MVHCSRSYWKMKEKEIRKLLVKHILMYHREASIFNYLALNIDEEEK